MINTKNIEHGDAYYGVIYKKVKNNILSNYDYSYKKLFWTGPEGNNKKCK